MKLLYELHPDNRDWVGGEAESIQAAYDMVVCLLDTGCRYGELVSLEWSNIDLQQKTIHRYRPKVQNESILFMTDRVFDILTRRFNDRTTPWIFPNDNKTGPRKHPSWCIRGAMNRAGLEEYTTHDLRHTAASRLAMAGVSLLKISQILGHSKTEMTARYAHLQPNVTAREAADVFNQLNNR